MYMYVHNTCVHEHEKITYMYMYIAHLRVYEIEREMSAYLVSIIVLIVSGEVNTAVPHILIAPRVPAYTCATYRTDIQWREVERTQ